jgi:TPR repeat protein
VFCGYRYYHNSLRIEHGVPGNANGKCLYGVYSRDGKGISKELSGAVHYFKLSADQRNAEGQNGYGCCLRDGKGI